MLQHIWLGPGGALRPHPTMAGPPSVLSDCIMGIILWRVAKTQGLDTWRSVPCVCRQWRKVWAHILAKKNIRVSMCMQLYRGDAGTVHWQSIAPNKKEPNEHRGLMGDRNFDGNLALLGKQAYAAAEESMKSSIRMDTTRSNLAMCMLWPLTGGYVYDMSYRAIHRLAPSGLYGNITASFVQDTFADIMCVGRTVVVSSCSGRVQALSKQGYLHQILQNKADPRGKRQPISALSNHDPDGKYGALLAFTTDSWFRDPTCLLWVIRESDDRSNIKIAASLPVGFGSDTFKSVAISKSGKWACIEAWHRKTEVSFCVYAIEYGSSVFLSDITEHRVITHDFEMKRPCNDLVITDECVIAAGPCGTCIAWSIRTGEMEWALGRGPGKGAARVDALALSTVNDWRGETEYLAARSKNEVAVVALPA